MTALREVLTGRDPVARTGLSPESVLDLQVAARGPPTRDSGLLRPNGQGHRARGLGGLHRASGDPDVDLPRWLRQGAPIGISSSFSPRGVSPTVPEPQPATALDSTSWQVDLSGRENHRSAEDHLSMCTESLDKMVRNGGASALTSLEDLASHLGSNELILNKLGLRSKRKPSGSPPQGGVPCRPTAVLTVLGPAALAGLSPGAPKAPERGRQSQRP